MKILVDMEDLANKITEKTKFVSLIGSLTFRLHQSCQEIAKLIHQVGALYGEVDGA